jgi:uncharacterized membrane protein (UPF0127 family)
MTHRSFPLLPAILAVCLALIATVGLAVRGPLAAGDTTVFELSKAAVVTAKGRFDFNVEMAMTPQQHEQGLQHRTYMAPSAGMLFDFGQPQPVIMWMKNTPISLDMLFIDGSGVIVNIAEATTPFSLTHIPSAGPVRAVMELNAGTVRRIGAKQGDRVIHDMFSAH